MRRTWIAALLAVTALVAPTAHAQDESPLTDEDRADLAWFEGLGYPTGAGKPFVLVRWGAPDQEYRGFLLEEDDTSFEVLALGLTEPTHQRSPPGTPEDQRISFERLRLDDACEEWLYGGESPAGPYRRWPFEIEPSIQTQVLVIADALHRVEQRRRDDRIVHALLEHSRSLLQDHYRHYPTPDDPSKPLRERVALDLADVELRRAQQSLIWLGYSPGGHGPSGEDRPEQLARFEAVVRRYPGTASAPDAERYATILRRMVREDQERKSAPPRSAEPTQEERIADLVFGLRDQYAAKTLAKRAPERCQPRKRKR